MHSTERRIASLNLTMQEAKQALAQCKTLDEENKQQGIIDHCLREIANLKEERKRKR